MQTITELRLDKWLWAARFFKTRKLAQDAVVGGKVHLNGQRTKPSKDVKLGDKLSISLDIYAWDIEVVALNPYRRPAEEARLLYLETEESQRKRYAAVAEQREHNRLFKDQYDHKPNKKERRQIHRFLERQES